MYLPTRLPTDETETRADPFSLDALIAWLRTKNPEETYCYLDDGHCLAAQFNTHCGRRYVCVTLKSLEYTPGEPFAETLERIACDTSGTFGAALSRATAIRGV